MRKEELILKSVGTLTRFGPYRRFIKKLDTATREDGLSGAVRTIFSRFHAETLPQWDGNGQRTKELLQDTSKPIILVSNHPHLIEPLFFAAALPPRRNFSVIALSGVEYFFGDEVKSHLIPVRHGYLFESKGHKKQRKEQNTKQLDNAVDRLSQGETIMIMPDGGDKTGNWRKGVLTLIEAARTLPEAYLVMAHIEGAKKRDLQKIFFNRLFRRQSYMQKKVRISEAIPIKSLPIPQETYTLPKEDLTKYSQMATSLQTFYDNWVDNSQEG